MFCKHLLLPNHELVIVSYKLWFLNYSDEINVLNFPVFRKEVIIKAEFYFNSISFIIFFLKLELSGQDVT